MIMAARFTVVFVLATLIAVTTGIDNSFYGFCGGLPPPSPYVSYFSQAFIASDLPTQCKQWEGKVACCTAQTSRVALAELTDDYFNQLSLKSNDLSEERHCFYGFYEYECRRLYQWLQCAIQCDALMPRDHTTGLPTDDSRLCYERFTARNGIDAVFHGRQASACERAAQIKDLGECSAVVVVGQNDIAIAAGQGQAICESAAITLRICMFATVLLFLVRL